MAQPESFLSSSSPKQREWFGRSLRWYSYKFSRRMQRRMGWKLSFAQSGEDLIALRIFQSMGIQKPSYMDVGAFHPYRTSNTALLNLSGCRGINIEPNPAQFPAFVRERPYDINLNIGIADVRGELDYYEMSPSTLNTFSRESMEGFVQEGHPLVATRKIPVWTLAEVVDKYCQGQFVDFLSLDVEGMELAALSTIDFEKSAPIVICAETISYSRTNQGVKEFEVQHFLEGKGYYVFADTHLNTLFVKEDLYHPR